MGQVTFPPQPNKISEAIFLNHHVALVLSSCEGLQSTVLPDKVDELV
jgi:hypothetical protein